MEKYDPIRVLGEGSFGKVYLMRDKVRRKFVCVKIIKIKNIPKKEREATKVEVELLKRLNHPNIVRYIDSFLSRNNESLCIAMEYCDGGDLASQIKAARKKLFSEDKILHWFVQIALGVHYMHTKSVLHRDLKTQNIFLLGNGRLVLGDLGISKVLEGTMDFAQTCIGTPYYMSPEIFKNKPYSYKSDVWALGCVLYEMTTLNHAFDANSLNGLAQKIIKGRYPSIHQKYSRYLRELIGHMLLPEPKQRPDLDQILRKPFIRKHILTFFQNIASRPSQSIGEGTMIVRAAGGGGIGGSLANDVNLLSFKEQLDSLGMTAAINEVLNGKQEKVEPAIFQDPVKAKRLAKEQSNALKREQDHRKMVESALEKLRKEREERARDRNRLAAAALRRRAGGEEKGVSQQSRYSDGPNKPAALRQPVHRRGHSEDIESDRGRRVSEARESHRRRQEALAAQHRREAEERREREAEKDRARRREELLEREKRDQARAQDEAMARREQQRQRERGRQLAEIDQLKKDKLELDKRSQERERIREERRRNERARLDDARNSGNLSVDGQSPAQSKQSPPDIERINLGDGLPPLPEEKQMSARDRMLQRKQEKQAKEDQERMEVLREAEIENRKIRAQASNQAQNQYVASGSTSARGGRDEDDAAQNKNQADRKARGSMEELTAKLHQARGAGGPRYEYAPTGRNGQGKGEAQGDGRSGEIVDYDSDSDDEDEASYEFGNSGEIDEEVAKEEQEDMLKREEELQAELNLATKRCQELKETLQVTKSFLGKGPMKNEGGTKIVADAIVSEDENEESDSDDDVVEEYDEDEDNSWEQPRSNLSTPQQTSRDTREKEREKQAQEYKRSESIMEDLRVGCRVEAHYRGGNKVYRGKITRVRLDGTYDVEYDDGECESRISKALIQLISENQDKGRGSIGAGQGAVYRRLESDSTETPRETPRMQRPTPIAVKQSSFKSLVDAPSPRGRLGDRIARLRQRCLQALGKEAFEEAYAYLKDHSNNDDDDILDDEMENQKALRVRQILGKDKAHYMPLIDQLIFMEDTHSG